MQINTKNTKCFGGHKWDFGHGYEVAYFYCTICGKIIPVDVKLYKEIYANKKDDVDRT